MERQTLSFQGCRVNFAVLRPEAQLRRRLLLLSSSLSTGFHWRKILPELTETGCLVVVCDLPGFGESDLNCLNWSVTECAKVLWGILDTIDSQYSSGLATWHLVGHGAASPVILTMANLYPDSVRSQVHISPCLPLDRSGRFARQNERAVEKLLEKNMGSMRAFYEFIIRAAGKPLPDYVWEPMWRPFLRPRVLAALARFLASEHILSPAVGFCPTMALWGGEDPLLPPNEREAVLRLFPEAETHIIRSAGHFPMETHSRAVRDFLRGWIRYVEEQ